MAVMDRGVRGCEPRSFGLDTRYRDLYDTCLNAASPNGPQMTDKNARMSTRAKAEAAQGRADREAKAMIAAEAKERKEKTERLKAERLAAEESKKEG